MLNGVRTNTPGHLTLLYLQGSQLLAYRMIDDSLDILRCEHLPTERISHNSPVARNSLRQFVHVPGIIVFGHPKVRPRYLGNWIAQHTLIIDVSLAQRF